MMEDEKEWFDVSTEIEAAEKCDAKPLAVDDAMELLERAQALQRRAQLILCRAVMDAARDKPKTEKLEYDFVQAPSKIENDQIEEMTMNLNDVSPTSWQSPSVDDEMTKVLKRRVEALDLGKTTWGKLKVTLGEPCGDGFGLSMPMDMDPYCFEALVKALRMYRGAFIEIDMSKAPMSTEQMGLFADHVLKGNKTIRSLNVDNSALGADGVSFLASALRRSPDSSLGNLRASGVKMDDSALRRLCKVLKQPDAVPNLSTLHIGKATYTSLKPVVELLKCKPSLRELSVARSSSVKDVEGLGTAILESNLEVLCTHGCHSKDLAKEVEMALNAEKSKLSAHKMKADEYMSEDDDDDFNNCKVFGTSDYSYNDESKKEIDCSEQSEELDDEELEEVTINLNDVSSWGSSTNWGSSTEDDMIKLLRRRIDALDLGTAAWGKLTVTLGNNSGLLSGVHGASCAGSVSEGIGPFMPIDPSTFEALVKALGEFRSAFAEIDMSNAPMNTEQMGVFADHVLKGNKTLRGLNVNNSTLGADGVSFLASALRCNPDSSLCKLKMSGVKMNDSGLQRLCKVLKQPDAAPNLSSLYIGKASYINLQPVIELLKCKPSLRELSVASSPVRHAGGLGAAIARSNLEVIHYNGCNSNSLSKEVDMALKAEESKLCMSYAKVDLVEESGSCTGFGAAEVSDTMDDGCNNTNITAEKMQEVEEVTINLSDVSSFSSSMGCSTEDELIKMLRRRVEALDLGNAAWGKLMVTLGDNAGLFGSGYGESCAGSVTGGMNPFINIDSCTFEALVKALKIFHGAFVEIDMSNAPMSTEQMGVFADVVIKGNKTLRCLKVDNSPLGADGVSFLASALRHTTDSPFCKLSIFGVNMDDSALRRLCNVLKQPDAVPNLAKLNIGKGKYTSLKPVVELLKCRPSLRELSVARSSIRHVEGLGAAIAESNLDAFVHHGCKSKDLTKEVELALKSKDERMNDLRESGVEDRNTDLT